MPPTPHLPGRDLPQGGYLGYVRDPRPRPLQADAPLRPRCQPSTGRAGGGAGGAGPSVLGQWWRGQQEGERPRPQPWTVRK